ncbi:hypothetical protein C8035_v004550 [Colletotrichum spinosum]|uniref:Uncharacterized protein n=1 Tax=Colletotrichum spinosum TaxID=1347390 RepID=A0A4R8PUH7_9PEZI|nr:hypothetical protein C8035_v004550 [Colletotrichum spinosum]
MDSGNQTGIWLGVLNETEDIAQIHDYFDEIPLWQRAVNGDVFDEARQVIQRNTAASSETTKLPEETPWEHLHDKRLNGYKLTTVEKRVTRRRPANPGGLDASLKGANNRYKIPAHEFDASKGPIYEEDRCKILQLQADIASLGQKKGLNTNIMIDRAMCLKPPLRERALQLHFNQLRMATEAEKEHECLRSVRRNSRESLTRS